jgi:beta-1,4-mannosyl-glycoprotein beta-1,4-N-acetylglucosaminyltransferase
VFDAFLFDGELDLLEHRLSETYELVDWFVLVEAGQTFRGDAKVMTFAANKARFTRYAPKIRHVALPGLGASSGGASAAWERERFQRNAMLFALGDLSADDVVLILDADELPSRQVLQRLRADGLDSPRRLAMTRHYLAADLLAPASACCPPANLPFPFAAGRKRVPSWDCLGIEWLSRSGVALPGHALIGEKAAERRSPHQLRLSVPVAGAIPGAGRHLCFVDPSARPAQKLGRVAHAELASERAKSPAHLARCNCLGVHHRGWWYAERPAGALPEDLMRLTARCASIQTGQSMPGTLRRRVIRTWAWLRLWERLPERLVRAMDSSELVLWVLTPLLLAVDLARAAAGYGLRKRTAKHRVFHP